MRGRPSVVQLCTREAKNRTVVWWAELGRELYDWVS